MRSVFGEVAAFEMVAIRCQYERETSKHQKVATETDLEPFNSTEQLVPSARLMVTPSIPPRIPPR